ncbi:radical SAM family heme chaperone HemW [Eremococcus coleocola]|uniref:Heme chaperone HemW n=1 Tax=Eremococcus coleocola ACS-139-V-Col8 TaxID=908337 RepID=E4KPU1_9LACT|nr:radical SAM family heme chaperone HemW [Eremococcus coleocola]EFR31008.1 putative oxygen-independent coproporphyrinogen III oxidase [Eremococcus coleocola ACS-139-V-Col8]
MAETIGLYVHIPFCQKLCHYCDFLTFEDQDDVIPQYVDYLIKEMQLYQDRDYILDTIYFGGGTPSHLEADLMAKIMDGIYATFKVTDDCEVSIEMNPESVTEEKIKTYQAKGFNRFSMGVQSFDPKVLQIMGRLHSRQTAIDKFHLLRDLGCDNVSIDLMFNNPRQDMDILNRDIDQAIELNPNHISYYSLMIKDNTNFQRWLKAGRIKLFDEKTDRDMYHNIQDRLSQAGFNQYEISSFARDGKESRHNKKYWQLENYLGVGMGASSNIDLRRFTNTRRFKDYFAAIDQGQMPVESSEMMDLEEREKEFIMLNMRLRKGFDISVINQRFGIDFKEKYKDALEKHLKYKVIQIEGDHIYFTDYGLDVGNQFYLDIL